MPERTWKAAFGEVSRAAAKHKLASGVIAAAVVASFAGIAWAGTSSGAPAGSSPPADPVAASFSLPVLGHSGVGSSRLSLSSYAGKPLVVNFFASWCEPCKQETPLLAKFYRTEHGKVALVGLDENDAVAKALKFLSAQGVTYPVGWDPNIVAASSYGVNGLPQTFFLDARHRVVYRKFGAVTSADLSKGITLATRGAAGSLPLS
jgi:cytochrome c biogenesis protein CcmG/thiol:disulfide interchange protein DsbE